MKTTRSWICFLMNHSKMFLRLLHINDTKFIKRTNRTSGLILFGRLVFFCSAFAISDERIFHNSKLLSLLPSEFHHFTSSSALDICQLFHNYLDNIFNYGSTFRRDVWCPSTVCLCWFDRRSSVLQHQRDVHRRTHPRQSRPPSLKFSWRPYRRDPFCLFVSRQPRSRWQQKTMSSSVIENQMIKCLWIENTLLKKLI